MGSEQGEKSRMCQESHILGVWEEVALILEKKSVSSFFMLCKILKTMLTIPLFAELCNGS